MREVEVSSMIEPDDLALADFEDSTGIQVRHRPTDWTTGWNHVLQIALFQKGPDLSETGSTWLTSLRDMQALRPFKQEEMQALGGGGGFLPTAWPAGEGYAPGQRISVPWLADTRLIFYRRDLLAQAGIGEEGAFATPEALHDTLARLRAAGMTHPLAMATGGLSLHNMACFVWGRGGHFRSPDFRKVGLVEAEARQGLSDYFRMHAYIHPDSRRAEYSGADRCYFQGKAAVLISGQWVMQVLANRALVLPEVAETNGIAAPPGVPYVGSSHLVIWRHSLHEDEAFQFVRHAASPAVLRRIFYHTGGFPARLEVLNQPPFSTDERCRLVRDCLKRGRGFRSAKLWAGVEMRFNEMCDQLWADLFANPALNLESEIDERIVTMAERLEKTLLAG